MIEKIKIAVLFVLTLIVIFEGTYKIESPYRYIMLLLLIAYAINLSRRILKIIKED